MQEFFEYRMGLTLCGIPAVSMQGTEEDWKNLVRKLENLEELLHPIREQIRGTLTLSGGTVSFKRQLAMSLGDLVEEEEVINRMMVGS